MRLIFQAVLLFVPLLASAATPPERLAELDALFVKRDDTASLKALDQGLSEGLKADPKDFELMWRLARMKQWVTDGAADPRLQKQAAKETWDAGDRARKLRPDRVEGHFFAAAGLGTYATSVGVLNALRQGLEGEFNERIDKALKIDPYFEMSSPLLAKARYYFELPWPKRDLDKSLELSRKALAKSPENLRARLYYAETLLKNGDAKAAQAAMKQVQDGSGTYDAAEARRVKTWAKPIAKAIREELE